MSTWEAVPVAAGECQASGLRERQPPAGDWAAVVERSIAAAAHLATTRQAVLATVGSGLPTPAGPLVGSLAERLALVVGELAANGLRHGRPPVTVRVARRGTRWLVAVEDAGGPSRPQLRPADATGGRGLAMVRRLSGEIGWYRRAGRTVVWAELTNRPPAVLRTLR